VADTLSGTTALPFRKGTNLKTFKGSGCFQTGSGTYFLKKSARAIGLSLEQTIKARARVRVLS
jgi:hypothetical protein